MQGILKRSWLAGRRYWQASTSPQRLLFITGTVLFLSMLFHSGVLIITGSTMQGPVSFRKAIAFAEALGLLCWSIGWALPFFRFGRRGAWLIAGYISLFAALEVFLMSMQVWRGVPSHYNFNTPFDSAVFAATGIAAAIFALVTLLLLVWPMHTTIPANIWFAIRVGLLITAYGNIIGMIMGTNNGSIWLGFDQFLLRAVTARNGYAPIADAHLGGNLVILHALGIHGLQLVPLVAWLVNMAAISQVRRNMLTAVVGVGNLSILGLLSFHVLRALPFSSIEPWLVIALIVAGVITLIGYTIAGWLALRSMRGSSMAHKPSPTQAKLSYPR